MRQMPLLLQCGYIRAYILLVIVEVLLKRLIFFILAGMDKMMISIIEG